MALYLDVIPASQIFFTVATRTEFAIPDQFNLIVTAAEHSAEFCLLDEHGVQIAFHQTKFNTISISHQQGLFDLRNYLRHYVEEDKEASTIAEVGVCIAEKVLGQEIFNKLCQSQTQRTLRIQLPGATQEENLLAAALARVPWEIARPGHNQQTLAERNLVVRIEHGAPAPASQPLQLGSDEALRVLFVFAESRGSHPLGARKERRELLKLFEKEIYPHRSVVAHFLTHGVTRERLQDQIQENGGYHVVHWSGHGNMNLLELCRPGGDSDQLSGQELLDLFTKQAGGFLPRLFFLSACHSGDILSVKNWNDFLAVAQDVEHKDERPGAKQTETKDLDLKQQPGYTGVAHVLLQGGVPTVVAMRYAVGDDYARELALEFYRALLAHAQPKNAAVALTRARHALLDAAKHEQSHFAVCDHATPLLYGAEQPGIALAQGRSRALNPRDPRLHRINELTMMGHEHFVGRTWELVELGADFIGSKQGAEVKPVAVIIGLGGMGKTALTAEALALWESRFVWVLLYQAKPDALSFDATLRDIHIKLVGEEKQIYYNHIQRYPSDAIYRDASAEFTGPERLQRLTRNLLRALKDEAILLVLDNFENNLKQHSATMEADGHCQNPAWDHCLSALAIELAGSPSRVLITCRRPIAALDGVAHHVLLGPLPASEAALYLREHRVLSPMVFGSDDAEKKLAIRLLNASRFHPLLMDRLARLAADAGLRQQLLQVLDTLEKTKDFAQLPTLFATTPGDTRELAYLDDALATSLDQLIRAAIPDARRLLWIIATANEPVALWLLNSVWSGNDDLAKPDVYVLLRYLLSVGLLTGTHSKPINKNHDYTCHELVRERIYEWMRLHPLDRSVFTEYTILLAYANRLKLMYDNFQHRDMTTALGAGRRALIYYVQAGAWDLLSGFANDVITSTRDPRLIEGLIPLLHTAVELAPEGSARWNCIRSLANALKNVGRPDASLPFYEQAASMARSFAEKGSENSQQAWADLARITVSGAIALRRIGNPDAARQWYLKASEAFQNANCPLIHILANELEVLRLDIIQGKVDAALPEVEVRLDRVKSWWRNHSTGHHIIEAPDTEFLARVFIGALDVAKVAYLARRDWDSALNRIDDMMELRQTLKRPKLEVAIDRFNRANVLTEIPSRFGEARVELEDCLRLFQSKPDWCAKVLSALADLYAKQGDVNQAITQQSRALALREVLPDVADRAISHNNLANHLERSDTPSARATAPNHMLAALVYRLVAGLGQELQNTLQNYTIDYRRANAVGTELRVPCVSELLDDPAFDSLQQWLLQRQVNIDELQAKVNSYLDVVRQAVSEQY